MSFLRPALLLLFAFLSACQKSPVESAKLPPPPQIPLKDFFDNPKISSARISPDGSQLAFLAPQKGRLNVWVCSVAEGPEKARCVTHDEKRGIFRFFWTRDGRYIIYAQDGDGDENDHLFRVDFSSKEAHTVDLTPFPGSKASVLDLPREKPGEMLIELNQRDKRVFDVYRANIETGRLALLVKNPGDVEQWVTDCHGAVRGCTAVIGKGATELRVRDTDSGPFRSLGRYTDEEDASIQAFSKDGKGVYLTHARGSNTTRLLLTDLASGSEELVDEDPGYDIHEALFSDVTYELLGVTYHRERLEYKPYDARLRKDLAILGKVHDGDVLLLSSDSLEEKWIVAYNSPTDPGATYLYDRGTGEARFLYRPRPWLNPEHLVGMEPVSFPSRDGLTLHGYLSLPKGREPKALPLLLVVHGGPWVRDEWGYDPEVQFLANRGYAVLQVNYRGSSGYGKKFLHAGDKEWGGKMLDDLIDATEWSVSQGFADRKRLAIYGGSYGGYATLAALAFRPEVFRCGVDYVGISNLLTFMNTIPPYWDNFRDTMYRRVGNPKTEEAFLKSRSPLFAVDKIQAPLFIAQGYNDPRVNHAEAEQMVKALQSSGKTVEYLVKMDEGHGFANPENRLEFYQRMEEFLKKHL